MSAINLIKHQKIRLGRLQELENRAREVLADGRLENATGSLLQDYGDIAVQARRLGWDDDTYRFWVQRRLQAQRSKGTAPDLIKLAKDCRVAGSTTLPRYKPEFPAGYWLWIPDVETAFHDLVSELFTIATMAGVRGVIVVSSSGATPFTYDRSPGSTYGWDAGQFASTFEVIGTP